MTHKAKVGVMDLENLDFIVDKSGKNLTSFKTEAAHWIVQDVKSNPTLNKRNEKVIRRIQFSQKSQYLFEGLQLQQYRIISSIKGPTVK